MTKATILIVDDMPENLSLLGTILARNEYLVSAANSGEKAVEIARRLHPDLILLDLMMPGIDGIETCKRIKAHASTRDIPVIFMTALKDSDQAVKAFNSGAVDYVVKPYTQEVLLARVGIHLKLAETLAALAESNRRLQQQAITDGLTQTCNHTHIIQCLKKQIQEAERYGKSLVVSMLDIDHFKAVNDQLGHQLGDNVLKAVAGVIKAGLREVDQVGRYGGEEFLVLMPNTTLSGAREALERIRQRVTGTHYAEQSPAVSISAGLCLWQAGQSHSELINCADQLLYQAKNNGRNCIAG